MQRVPLLLEHDLPLGHSRSPQLLLVQCLVSITNGNVLRTYAIENVAGPREHRAIKLRRGLKMDEAAAAAVDMYHCHSQAVCVFGGVLVVCSIDPVHELSPLGTRCMGFRTTCVVGSCLLIRIQKVQPGRENMKLHRTKGFRNGPLSQFKGYDVCRVVGVSLLRQASLTFRVC